MARKCAVFTVFLTLLAIAAPARDTERGVLALDQALRDVASDLRAMMVVVRPGEEDLETLALLRRSFGVKTRVVFLTRGEGSSEVPGAASEREEGARHTTEARRATSMVGAEARFLGLPDFGPSRSTQEVWARWGGSDGVRALVAEIREFRPQLILISAAASGYSAYGEVEEGFVREAFAAAADPDEFPETGAAFKPLRLFAAAGDDQAGIRIDVGRFDPVRGASYAEIGLAARRQYAGPNGRAPAALVPGPRLHLFRLVLPEGVSTGEDLLHGIEIARPEWLEEEARSGTRDEILRRLLALRSSDVGSAVPPRRMGAAVAAAAGLDIRVTPPEEDLVEDGSCEVRIDVVNSGRKPVRLEGIRFSTDSELDLSPVKLEPAIIAPGASFTGSLGVGALSPGDQSLAVTALFRLETGEGPFPLTVRTILPVRTPIEGRIKPWGRLIRPVMGRAIASLEILNRSPIPLEGKVFVSVEGTDALEVTAPDEIRVAPGERRAFPVIVEIPDRETVGLFPVTFRIGGAEVRDYLRLVDVEVPRELHIAVVATKGDAELRALRALQVRAQVLTDDDLEILDLANLDTILIGEEPFAHRPVLRRVWTRLLEFVERGGNLVMASCPDKRWEPSMGPYRLAFGTESVTEEDARIVISDNDHRLLRFPNELGDADFSGWVRERGRNFPDDYADSEFKTILRTADPGRPLLPALLVAEKGRGTFLQCSLSLRLQIENLNPGALKLLANMISYPFRR